jgi:hypothetical protein
VAGAAAASDFLPFAITRGRGYPSAGPEASCTLTPANAIAYPNAFTNAAADLRRATQSLRL